jgi:hypothetical protein
MRNPPRKGGTGGGDPVGVGIIVGAFRECQVAENAAKLARKSQRPTRFLDLTPG